MVALRTDLVLMPDGTSAERDVVVHPGAVGIVALDDDDQVLMIRQYRHPVARMLWEIPAGLRDVEGEPISVTAERELLEETGYRARDWRVLADYFSSPGMTNERLRVYLARGLSEIGHAEREFVPENEEAHLLLAWVPLDRAVEPVPGRRPPQRSGRSGYLVRVCRQAGRVRGAAPRGRAGALARQPGGSPGQFDRQRGRWPGDQEGWQP